MSQVEDLYCDHFDQFTNQQFQELFNEVAAIRAKNKDLFEFTHRPIEVFPSERAGQDDVETVREDEILEYLQEDRNRNYAVVIEGETGTGKSELCAYLVHQLRERSRPILRVDKDDDLMSILTKRLPAFYEEHFDDALPQAGAFERLEKNIKENPQTVANFAATGALLKFSKRGIETNYDRDDERVIADILESQLENLITSGEYGKERNLLSKQQYDRESAFHVFGPETSKTEAIEQWNTELWNVIRDEYDTPPLSDMLAQVGEKFTDRRPVVVFEDFSIASLEAKRLRNYIERDRAGDRWDFIIAGTRDVTEVMHSQTAEDRFEFFQTNKPNSNSVLFLDEESAVEFIRPYLAYFKTHDNSVQYHNDTNGNRDFSALRAAPEGSVCGKCELCADAYRDLFPFNQTFLRRIYRGLEESQQSPREYVSKVYDVLQEYYWGGTTAPSSSSALGSDVNNSEVPADDVYDRQEAFADLAKWYGTKKGGEYVVDRAFVTAFGLVPETRQPGTLDAGIIIEDEVIRIPAAGDDGDGLSPDPNPDPDETPSKSKVERIYEDHLGDVDDWIDDPGNSRFSETNSYIRAALTDLIEHVTDDYRLWTDGALRYNLSSQKAPFIYGAAAEQLGDDQIILDTEEFRPSEVRQLLKYGIRLEEAPDSANREAQLESLGTHITYYANNWRQQIIDQNIETNAILYRKADRSRFDFDDFVIATYALITLLDDPWHDITAERLNERYRDGSEYELDNGIDTQLQRAATHDEYTTLTNLFEYADEVESLVKSRFGVVADTLDVPEIRERLQQATPSRVLGALAQTHISKISGRVRFSSSKTLEDIAKAAYRSHDTLRSLYEEHHPFKIHIQVREIFADVDIDRIGEIADRLSTYDSVDQHFVESLSQFANVEQAEINALVDAAKMVDNEFDPSVKQGQLQILAADMRITGSDVIDRFSRVQDEWAEPNSTGSADRFSEVGTYYVR